MVKFCSLFSGSSGNCLFFGNGETKILVDAGLSRKKIFKALDSIDEDPAEIKGILLTHEHGDHIKGAGTISKTLDIPIYATPGTWEKSHSRIGDISSDNVVYIKSGNKFNIEGLTIEPYKIPHDAREPVGYSLTAGNKKVVIATDIGKMTKRLLTMFRYSDLLFLESNHDVNMLKTGKYPYFLKRRILSDNGHLCNKIAAKTVSYMVKSGITNVVLGHLSDKNNHKELAYETTKEELEKDGIIPGRDVKLNVADRCFTGKVHKL